MDRSLCGCFLGHGVPYTTVSMVYILETRLLGSGEVFTSEARVRHLSAPVRATDQSLPAIPRQVHVRLVTN